MLNLFESQPPIGLFLRLRRLQLERDIDTVAAAASVAPDRVLAIESWNAQSRRWEIPLVAEVSAIARALDTTLETVIAEAQQQGYSSVALGVPANREKRELVPQLVYVTSQTLCDLPDLTAT